MTTLTQALRGPVEFTPDLSRWSDQEIQAVAAAINGRPRKILGWKTPAEAFEEHLQSLQEAGGATIG